MRDAFLNKFLYDAAANLEIEMKYMRRYKVEGDEQHVSGELRRVKESGTEDSTSVSIDGTTSTSTNGTTSTSIDGTTSESIAHTIPASIDGDSCFRSTPFEIHERSSCPHDIADSTLESTNISSCDPTSDGDIEITMENFLDLEEFLELEDGEKLEDFDSSREITMETSLSWRNGLRV